MLQSVHYKSIICNMFDFLDYWLSAIFRDLIFTIRTKTCLYSICMDTRAFGHACFFRSNGVCRPVFDPEAEHEGSADPSRPLRAP